ncbi:MAG: glycosyltransferase [Sphingomicrobium sp.]
MIIVHVIVDLNTGGAEMMLKRLIQAHRRNDRFQHYVISLHSVGVVGPELTELGVSVEALGLRRGSDIPRVLWRLGMALRRLRPDVVHGWMYHANLFAGLTALVAGRPRVIWGIRASTLDDSMGVAATTLRLRRYSALASMRLPDVIVYVAEAARRAHEAIGYDAAKAVVIPNGYPPPPVRTGSARPASEAPIVIGSVGRFNAAKDPKAFVEAAARVAAVRPNVRFLMIGRGFSLDNRELVAWISAHGLEDRFSLRGEQKEVYDYLASMDIFCLHSVTEAFPNVVAEAMNAAVPCVVTDVGDAALLLGDAGLVVPPRDPEALAGALIRMVDAGPHARHADGQRGRERIARHFSLDAVVRRYEELYLGLTGGLPLSSHAFEVQG